jgi:hypothetical protein
MFVDWVVWLPKFASRLGANIFVQAIGAVPPTGVGVGVGVRVGTFVGVSEGVNVSVGGPTVVVGTGFDITSTRSATTLPFVEEAFLVPVTLIFNV